MSETARTTPFTTARQGATSAHDAPRRERGGRAGATHPREAPRSSSVRRAATLSAGWLLVATGTVLLVLPGPGLLFIVGGLAVLGREVAWARRLHERLSERLRRQRRPAARGAASRT